MSKLKAGSIARIIITPADIPRSYTGAIVTIAGIEQGVAHLKRGRGRFAGPAAHVWPLTSLKPARVRKGAALKAVA